MGGALIKEVLDCVFPNFSCLVCRDELNSSASQFLCDDCVAKLPLNNDPITLRDSNQRQYFYKTYCPFEYKDEIVGLILRLKYNAEKSVADAFAPFMSSSVRFNNEAVLVPVPLSTKRQKQRGYNQAELLAIKIGEISGAPVRCDVIERVRATEAQKHMSVTQRAENLKNAFAVCNSSPIKSKVVWLVDDVFTSGSTVNECARMLIKAGAKEVNVITIAVVVH